MKTYTLINDGARNVSFTGEKLAKVSSHSNVGPGQNRWTEIKLYRTQGGALVLKITGRTCWQGESDRHRAIVCADEDAVVTALIDDNGGELGDLAKELIEAVGIDATEKVA